MSALKTEDKLNRTYMLTSGSGYPCDDDSPPELKKYPPPDISDLKFVKIWKRAKGKILSHNRIQKMITNAKNLRYPNEPTEKDSINTEEIKAFYKTHIKTQTEEERKKKSNSCCFTPIKPDSRLRNIWDSYLGIWLLYSCTVTPVSLAFFDSNPGDPLFVIDMIIDFSFLLDLILNFNTGFYDKEGTVVLDRWEIAKHYMLSWFCLDLVAAFPTGLVEIGIGSGHNSYNSITRIVKMRNIVRLLKVSRAVKFFKVSQKDTLLSAIQNFLKISYSTRRLITTLLMIIISIHIFACLFYYINVYNDFSPDSWTVRYGIQDSSAFNIYLSSFYYSVVTITTVGYGDITPRTQLEKCLAIIWMAVAVYFLSFVISSLSSTLAQTDVKRSLLEQKLALLDCFSDEVGIDKITKKKIQDEIRFKIMRSTYSSSLKGELIQDLSSELKNLIASKMYNGIIEVFKFFSDKDQIFISTIFPLLEAHHFIENELIYSENDFPDYIYFLGRGRVHLMTADINQPFSVLNVGSYFGELEIVQNTKRMFSVVSPKSSFLLGMGLSLVARIQEDFSKVWDELQNEAENRQKKIIRSIAEMRVLLKLNSNCMIGKINSQEVKDSIHEEIKAITLEYHNKSEKNDYKELVAMIKEEIKTNKEMLGRIEFLVKKLDKKEKERYRKPTVAFPV